MKHYLENHATSSFQFPWLSLALVTSLFLPLPSLADSVALATSPLATSTTSTVKPNIMFILDDSTSMEWNYLPDWATDTDPFTSTSYVNEPPLHKNNGFNGVAYNPAITYTSPIYYYADGSTNKDPATGASILTLIYPDMVSPWSAVKRDGYGIQETAATTDDLRGNAKHYVFQFAEYCTSSKMTDCLATTALTNATLIAAYAVPAKLRWCNSSALTNCQSINNSTYKWPRYPRAATATVTLGTTTTTKSVSNITVDGKNIMSAAAVGDSDETITATNIAAAINACTAAITGSCTVAGYSATASAKIVTITAPANGAITYLPVIVPIGAPTITLTAFSGGVPGSNIYTNIVSTTANYPYPGSTTKAATRTDCAGTTCTYAEEMNNYANWWAYYHTRMQSMKTAVSHAFKNIDSNYRVGYTTISSTNATDGTKFLGNNTFELAHKNSWYTKLLNADPRTSSNGIQYTPLRGALSKAGRYYGKKITGQTDPVQYSCQQNFAMLSTDGYWNTNDEITGSYGPLDLAAAKVGNLDPSTTTARPLREGTTAVSDTLADVAKYYYDTDLRDLTLWNNCSGALGLDVCTDNVFISPIDNNVKQHMTTFTMGLGADGTLNYTTDYETATSGDYYDLKKGYNSINWPTPAAGSSTTIDDLWHAAVNGRGAYFSAKNPNEIITGFTRTLSSITSKLGSAAAAATSTLNPIAGNNFAYVASYTTVAWKGNLESRTIDINTGVVSETASWCVENVVSSTCTLPNTVVTDTSGSNNITYCVAPGATLATCAAPSIFDSATSTCKTEISNACTGTMASLVGASSDSRTIYTNVGSTLVDFNDANAGAIVKANISGLTQWASLSAAQQTLAQANLVNYLRGRNGYEDRASNTDKLFRAREAVTGDALESQPAYTSIPAFNYPYPGYSAYATSKSSRAGTVYMGTNDGMLHAFDAATGIERWAYVPSMVLANMWQLADTSYSTRHRNYVNGSPYISDICTANCTTAAATWKTILVGGLNGGGRGYYALDITDVGMGGQPTLLWEFTPTNDADLGYTFGQPIITRDASGKWVVLLTSGYDNGTDSATTLTPTTFVPNSPSGSGLGYLYVRDAATGAHISKISTGAGSSSIPSGLAKIAAWNTETVGNTAGYVYGGDLLGNVWRFNINTGAVVPFATLLDASGVAQPITTTPVLGEVSSQRVIFIGTGKYLETGDLTTTQRHTQYAIKDDDSGLLTNARSALLQQTLVTSGSSRTSTGIAVDFSSASGRGWYIDFPAALAGEGSERVNIDAQLVQGVLIVPTIVPSNTICSPGGYAWLNFINYETGSTVGIKYDSTIVGINVLYIKGKPIVSIVTSTTPTPNQPAIQPTFGGGGGKFVGKRVIWRELIPH